MQATELTGPALDAMPIRVDSLLAGTCTAVLLKGELHVSPAMWELLKNADADELPLLLKGLQLVNLDKYVPDMTAMPEPPVSDDPFKPRFMRMW